MGSKSGGKRTPAIWERDTRPGRQTVRVKVEREKAPDEEREAEDWRRTVLQALGAAAALEAVYALAVEELGSQVGLRLSSVGPLPVNGKGVAAVAGMALVLDLYTYWRMEHGLGRRTVGVMRDLHVGRGLKFPPKLEREEQRDQWVTDLYFKCPPGLTDVKLEEHSRAISQGLNVTVMDVYFDDDSGCVVMRLGAGKIPRSIGFEEFVRRYLPPPGELVVPLWIGRDGPRWIDLAEASMLVTGMNRSGKTNWLRVALTYLALNTDVQLRLIDMKSGGVEFNLFRGLACLSGRPIASTTMQALELLRDVTKELEQREQLWAEEGVNNFAAYNRKFPGKRLPWVLTVIDERHRLASESAAARSSERKDRQEIEELEARLVAQGAGSGFRVVDTTQLANVLVLPALSREQLVERHLAFKAGTGSAARIPGMEAATKLRGKGRAVLAEGGGEISIGQTPLLEREDAVRLLELRQRLEPRPDAAPDLHVVPTEEATP